MQITATWVSTNLENLITTAWYSLNTIKDWRNTIKDLINNFWVFIKNTWANSIFIEYILSASATTSYEIIAWADLSLSVFELSKINLITAWAGVTAKILIV